MIVLLHTGQVHSHTGCSAQVPRAVNSGWPSLCCEPGQSSCLSSVPGPHRGFLPSTWPRQALYLSSCFWDPKSLNIQLPHWLCDLVPALMTRCSMNNLPDPFSIGSSGRMRPMAVQMLPFSCQAILKAFPEPIRLLTHPDPSVPMPGTYSCPHAVPLLRASAWLNLCL